MPLPSAAQGELPCGAPKGAPCVRALLLCEGLSDRRHRDGLGRDAQHEHVLARGHVGPVLLGAARPASTSERPGLTASAKASASLAEAPCAKAEVPALHRTPEKGKGDSPLFNYCYFFAIFSSASFATMSGPDEAGLTALSMWRILPSGPM